jgi:hypothetical protein
MAPDSNTKRIFICTLADEDLSRSIKKQVQIELPSYDVEMFSEEDDLLASLHQYSEQKLTVDWVVLDGPVNRGADQINSYGALDRLQNRILEGPGGVKTIRCFHSSEEAEEMRYRIDRRRLAVWCSTTCDNFSVELADVIDAYSENAIGYISPAVVFMVLRSAGDECATTSTTEASNNNSVNVVISLADSSICCRPSPFRFLVHDMLRGVNEESIELFGHSLCDEQGVVSSSVVKDCRDNGKRLTKIGVKLTEIHKSLRRMLSSNDHSAEHLPPLLHLHICVEDPRLLNVPLDHAICPDQFSANLSEEFPIVWTFPNRKSRQTDSSNVISIGHRNRSDHGSRLVTAYSFDSDKDFCGEVYNEIPEAGVHCENIGSKLRYLVKDSPQHIQTDEAASNFFSGVAKSKHRRVVYLITHGTYSPGVPDGAAICFSTEKFKYRIDAIGQWFEDRENHSPAEFLFLNSCLLGHQAAAKDTRNHYASGLIEAVAKYQVATEIILHRCKVLHESAKKMAELFFDRHPRTLYSRSAALHYARKHFVKNRLEDSIWFSPIHVTQCRKN